MPNDTRTNSHIPQHSHALEPVGPLFSFFPHYLRQCRWFSTRSDSTAKAQGLLAGEDRPHLTKLVSQFFVSSNSVFSQGGMVWFVMRNKSAALHILYKTKKGIKLNRLFHVIQRIKVKIRMITDTWKARYTATQVNILRLLF